MTLLQLFYKALTSLLRSIDAFFNILLLLGKIGMLLSKKLLE